MQSPTWLGVARNAGRHRVVALASLLIAASFAIAGCTTQPAADEDYSFDTAIAIAIDEAIAGGAGEQQQRILREAQGTGVLTLTSARDAALAVVDCVVAAGGDASYDEQVEESGLIVPGYVVSAESAEALDKLDGVIDTCDRQEGYFVNKFYQLQPQSQETRDAFLETQLPLIRDCLEEHGYVTDADASAAEVLAQAHQLNMDTDGAIVCDLQITN